MKYIYSIIKADYLQRTRSYSFLITLAITIYAAYSFVPPPTASYTTLNVVGYKGIYNSAWVGHVSAMMTTIMLSLYGFFLINGGIKKDVDTGIGQIIATTPITNFGYLLSKFLSNFFVLLTISVLTFLISIVMFFVRTSGSPFIIGDFILPFVFFAIPALFTVSALAIVAEVFLGRKLILQYIIFFFLFGALMANVVGHKSSTINTFIDTFGVNTMTNSVKDKVNTQYHEHIDAVNLGFTFSKKHRFKTFEWDGISWTGVFIASRLMWICIAFGLVYFSSFSFHRFDFKQASGKKKKAMAPANISHTNGTFAAGINVSLLPPVVTDYSIFPFVKTELLLLIRKGPKWFWLVNGGLWISMLFVKFDIAYSYLLPILLFLQVTRWSELATKEVTNRLHYFTWSSYKPLQRMLPSQLLAAFIMAVALALPVILRSAAAGSVYSVVNIINGAAFVVLLAASLGIVTGGKKLFEILFFFFTYLITQKMPLADYLGALPHDSPIGLISIMLMLNVFLGAVSFSVRSWQVRHL